MYSSLSWVPRGYAKEKLPEHVQHNAKGDDSPIRDMESHHSDATSEEEEGNGVDIGDILANNLDTLSFYKKNDQDPYLKSDPDANKLFDDDEMDDLAIRPTDALVIATKSGEDASTLEVHLFDDDPEASDGEEGPYVPHSYVHHDIVLPTIPLCTAFTNLPVNKQSLNLVAVGMFTPAIDIWDVDRVNNLEPLISLGGYEDNDHLSGAFAAAAAARENNKSKKKAKKPKIRLKDGSHKDAVMSLCWNPVQREYLASGSADTTVKVWDIESSHCACTLNHHSNKVQSVVFHPSSAELLLTGSFDRTVQIADVRDSSTKGKWSIEADVESCHWGFGPTADKVIVASETGIISVFDPRMSATGGQQQPLATWQSHKGAASGCAVSHDIPGLMVTGGMDKLIKVWDISCVSDGKPGELVYERPGKAGSLFAVSLCPTPSDETSNASPFVIAYGGAKGSLYITDLATESMTVRDRFLNHCPPQVLKPIEKRAVRGTKITAAQKRNESFGMKDDSDSDNSGSEGWESEGETEGGT